MKPLAFPQLTVRVITGIPGIIVHPFDQLSVEPLLLSSDFLLFLLSGCIQEVFFVCRQPPLFVAMVDSNLAKELKSEETLHPFKREQRQTISGSQRYFGSTNMQMILFL